MIFHKQPPFKLALIVIVLTFQNGLVDGQRNFSNAPNYSGQVSASMVGNVGFTSGARVSRDGGGSNQYNGWGSGPAYPQYSTPSGSGHPPSGSKEEGRVINNSILDDDEEEFDRSIMPMNYRPSQQETMDGFTPSRPMPVRTTTGPSMGNTYNGMMNVYNNNNNNRVPQQHHGMGGDRIPTGSRNPATVPQVQQPVDDDQPKIHRFVSIHVPPPEPAVPSRPPRPSQPAPKPDLHYNILFIKAPTPSPQELQEIQLPPPPETKTLVYVLLKKPQMSDVIKMQAQRPKIKPSKPEVFFIRYKDRQEQNGSTGGYSNDNTGNRITSNLVNNRNNGNLAKLTKKGYGNNGNENNVVYGGRSPGGNNKIIPADGDRRQNLRLGEIGDGGVDGGGTSIMSGGGYHSASSSSSSSESEVGDSDFSQENTFSLSSYNQQQEGNQHERFNVGGSGSSLSESSYSPPLDSKYGVLG